MIDGLPSGVQNLKIFEDFNEEYNLILAGASIYDDDSTSQIELSRTHGPELSTALAMRSQSLRNLSASYMIDAVDFFNHAAADETMRWENLESLCLSSVTLGLLDVSIDSEVNETLYLAGKVALRMPRLKKLDVWYAQRGIVFGFAYRSDGNDVTIQWKGTDSLQFGDKVISRWSQVAAARSGGRKTLTVLPEELIDGRLINSHATAIKVLGIGEDVLHPVSLKQIDHETERYFFGLQPTEEFEKVTAEQKAGDDDYWPGYRYAGSDGWGPIYVLDEA